MEELGEVTKSKDVSLETKAKIIHTLIFPVTIYSCKSWTGRKAGRKNITYSKYCLGGETPDCQIAWSVRKINKRVLEHFKPEISLEAKMTKLKLSQW